MPLAGVSPLFPLPQAKRLSFELLSALSFLHSRNVLHRDLKPANLLYSSQTGSLKVADFGLARRSTLSAFGKPIRDVSKVPNLTPTVVSLWYRSPELLLRGVASAEYDDEQHRQQQQQHATTSSVGGYGTGVDAWSAGCIIWELVARGCGNQGCAGGAPFRGGGEREQLLEIFDKRGWPGGRYWREWRGREGGGNAVEEFEAKQERTTANKTREYMEGRGGGIARRLPAMSEKGLLLIQGLLEYNVQERLSPRMALEGIAKEWLEEAGGMERADRMKTFQDPYETSR